MWVIILAIISCYILAACIVHGLYWIESKWLQVHIDASTTKEGNADSKSESVIEHQRSARSSKTSFPSLISKKEKHFVFIIPEQLPNLEWHLRSLFAYSRLTGRNIKLTIIFDTFSEEQHKLIERFSRKYGDIALCADPLLATRLHDDVISTFADNRRSLLIEAQYLTPYEKVTIVDLQKEEDLHQLPYY